MSVTATPAIVSEEVFDLAQLELQERQVYGNRYSGKSLFASRVVCGGCGSFFGSKVWHSTDRYRKTIWRCNRKYGDAATKQQCKTPHVTESALMEGFVRIMTEIITDKGMILADCQAILDSVMVTDELDRRIAQLQEQAQELAQRIRGVISEEARGGGNQEDSQSDYDPLFRRYDEARNKIAAAQKEKAEKESRARRIRVFMGMLESQEECLDFDPMLFTAFVEKVIVSGTKKEMRLTYVLRDGSEHTLR